MPNKFQTSCDELGSLAEDLFQDMGQQVLDQRMFNIIGEKAAAASADRIPS